MKQMTVVLICCFALNIGLFSKDMYLPALPVIAANMQTSYQTICLSMTLFIFSMAISQLPYGVLSDRYGRKPWLFIGLSLCFVGNILCYLAYTLPMFMTGRCICGIGAGSFPVITRALASDLYRDADLTRMLAYLSMATVVTPALAPLLGGWINMHFNWHIIFLCMALLTGCAIAILTYLISESRVHPVKPISVWHLSITLLSNRTFLYSAGLSIMSFAPGLIILMMSPAIFQYEYHFNTYQQGVTYLPLAFGYFMGSWSASKLINRLDEYRLIITGFVTCILSVMIILLPTTFHFDLSARDLIACFTIYTLGSGLITPIVNKQAISLCSPHTGYAAAMLGTLRLLGGFIITSLINTRGIYNTLTLGIYLGCLTSLGWWLHHCYHHHKKYATNAALH